MAAPPNVWSQMDYVPPRGQCNYKESFMSPKCPCLRFMLHPLKSSSSYECDGCSHHASYHSMENKTEDEIRKRWEQEAREKAERENASQQRPKKRLRAIEYDEQLGGSRVLGELVDGPMEPTTASNSRGGGRKAGATTRAGRKVTSKARSTTGTTEGSAIDLDFEVD